MSTPLVAPRARTERVRRHPVTVSVVIAAFQAERWIGETLESVLGQTYPADEIVVVDDGSTDDTPRILASYSDRIRIIRQENCGAPAAFNTGFRAARGDFVALCGADDVWDPRKLEWQVDAIDANPEVDVLFGHAEMFGRVQGDHARPPAGLTGLLRPNDLRDALFMTNFICAPSVLIRRSLYQELGPFVENFGAEDYEYWFRCLRAGASFYYDSRTLVHWRQHDRNLSARKLWMDECAARVRRHYAADVADRAMVRAKLAPDLFLIARAMVDAERPDDARRVFRQSLRYAGGTSLSTSVRAFVWTVVLALPARMRERLARLLVSLSRAFDDVTGGRSPALP